MTQDLFIGLMSGTSLDGVDGVLVDFAGDAGQVIQVIAHAHRAFRDELRRELLTLNTSGTDELHRAALAANALAHAYAQVVGDLLARGDLDASRVTAIGAHGQTVRHRPQEFDGIGYTLQLNNPALLAELTCIDVVADFRSRDVAAGGQGAPLVPAFHRAVFAQRERTVAVFNVGGISNITLLHADGRTFGFDCGPGNALMDHWCQQHRGQAFDRNGDWAATGQVNGALLQRLQNEPYFGSPGPKSTGRDLFNASWLTRMLAACSPAPLPADVQATLAELTAWACAEALGSQRDAVCDILVCGGGAYNTHLMHRFTTRLPAAQIRPSDAAGLPADQVEAAAFAWLAKACTQHTPGNLASVTGARGPRILGALYRAA